MVSFVADNPPSAYFSAAVAAFLSEDAASVLGTLAANNPFGLDPEQKVAWEIEIKILKEVLADLEGTLFLEFAVPRLGSRIDAVLISGPAIIPVEFKCGEHQYRTAARNQVWDYALDLKNFHEGSHHSAIFPILVATAAASGEQQWRARAPDAVYPPRGCRPADLHRAISEALSEADGPMLDGDAWGRAPYHPTPTIIEAARALYSRHSVDEISRSDAGAKNLRLTSGAVEEIIDHTRRAKEKAIVFLTGVPGAGKTLVGLNVATQRRDFGEARAVFLSGNGPLVAVLQEALVRDELSRRRGTRKGAILQEVKPFIQNVHHFRDEGVRNPAAPFDHVVIFDEAQRAWNRRKTADFMKRRKRLANFDKSESEFLISYLDRHPDWAVVICLVGGGQEIHDGEAGIAAWLDAVRVAFPQWQVYLSPDLTDSEYAADLAIGALAGHSRMTLDPRLHLSISMRSFRSEKVSAFVKALLDHEHDRARTLLREISRTYPIAITHDLARAKEWIRHRARGSERYGLVASSQAQRLKPHAIDIRVDINPVHWFLNDRRDTRSSYYLEDAATEFQIQGLELDWIGVNWDADLRLKGGNWRYHSFRGDAWTNVRNEERQRYMLNAYRVLLTRARQGMVIFVPTGESSDPTRSPDFYDETYDYLSGLGIEQA
ncbi:MAG TPA: DUF2075 domain-containing protein [Vicinamibacterales bacterium]